MASGQEQVVSAHQEVIADIREKWTELNGGPSMIEGMKAFAAAVDWTVRGKGLCKVTGGNALPAWPVFDHVATSRRRLQEWWICGLLAFQLSLFAAVLLLRKNTTFIGVVFFALSGSS